MFTINSRNVNGAFQQALDMLSEFGEVETSRNGPVLTMTAPVVTTYHRPWERVLFCPERDANPFFHVMEAIWMLAGRRSAAWPSKFNKQMAEYANEDGNYDGAYGYRWRHQFGFDQIDAIVSMLKKDRTTRRAVLTMFDPTTDLGATSKDIPCNTTIYFRVIGHQLSMTVCNRSNDAVWGAYGANAVHMSMLQEVVAAGVGIGIGPMHTMTNNLHIYTDVHQHLLENFLNHKDHHPDHPSVPICTDYINFKDDCMDFLGHPTGQDFRNPWFYFVARPMYLAWEAFKNKDMEDALSWASQIEDMAWSYACIEWLRRRQK